MTPRRELKAFRHRSSFVDHGADSPVSIYTIIKTTSVGDASIVGGWLHVVTSIGLIYNIIAAATAERDGGFLVSFTNRLLQLRAVIAAALKGLSRVSALFGVGHVSLGYLTHSSLH